MTSAPPAREASIWGEGQPDGVGSVQDGVKGEAGCVGNAVQGFGLDKGIERAGLVPAEVGKRQVVSRFRGRLGWRLRCMLRVGDLRRGGLGFLGGNGIAWVFNSGLVLLFAEPLSGVDIRLDGRGHGLRGGWGRAAVWNQSLDSYDHRESLDLAGDDAPGRFVAESGQFPEAGQDLVATKVQPAQPVGFLIHQLFPDGGTVLEHVGADARLGFGIGGGFGVKTDGFRGATVIHGSGHDQVSKGHFLIGDGIGDCVFGHRSSRSSVCWSLGWIYLLRSSWHRNREPQPGTDGCCWLFCDRDRVRYRIVVRLSFAHAKGRNCRQLPDRARLREEPSPADIVYVKRYSLSELDVSGRASFFGTGVPAKGHSGFGMRVGSGMKWVAKRLLWVPRRDAGVSVVHSYCGRPRRASWWSRKGSARRASGIGIISPLSSPALVCEVSVRLSLVRVCPIRYGCIRVTFRLSCIPPFAFFLAGKKEVASACGLPGSVTRRGEIAGDDRQAEVPDVSPRIVHCVHDGLLPVGRHVDGKFNCAAVGFCMLGRCGRDAPVAPAV